MPESQNAYLAMLALNARAAQPIVAAGAVARAQHAILADARRSHQDTLPRYIEIRNRLLDPANIAIPFRTDCKDDCYSYLIEHARLLETFSRKHARLTERYRAMLDLPAYAEDIPIDPEALSPNYSLANALAMAHLGKTVSALRQGNAQTAYKEWARHRRFWQMAAAGSVTLNGTLKAVMQIERSQALLSQMLKSHPKSIAAASRHVLPVLAARPKLVAVLARSLVHEFQIHAYIANEQVGHFSLWEIVSMGVLDDYPEMPIDRLSLLFYQRNATLNLLHRIHQNDMAQNSVALDGRVPPVDTGTTTLCTQMEKDLLSPDFWHWHLVSNPKGKALACQAGLNYRAQHGRAAKTDVAAKELEQMLAIR